MRNLKKILALVLALVMSFSLMATANAYTDADKITDTYETAVTVLSGLKVFKGYDNGATFQPQGPITRAEVAAIIYRIVTGDVEDTQVGIYADYNKFDDVKSTSWYAGYVNFCANAEYIKGYDAKTFGPNDPVTGYQALAMILRALGYDKNGEFTGANWQVQTAAVGENRGITKNITAGTLGVAATREVVAEILFRAILVEKVNYTPAFGYQLDDTSIGWDTFELEEITGVVVANEYADLYSTSPLKAGKTELDVDGESYTLSYSTALTDIGEARNAYITEGENVLYIADAGNTVFETGAATDIEKDKDFESATGLERDEDTTEYFINFDGGAEYKASDWKIKYVLTAADADEADAYEDEYGITMTGLSYTKTINPGKVISDTDMAIMRDIFYGADLQGDDVVKGEIYVGTQSNDDISDDSDMSWKSFKDKYIDTAENVVDFDETDNGEWLKVIDNDGDGIADYVLLTEFAMSYIDRISKDSEYTLADLADGDAVTFDDNTVEIDGADIVTEDELAEGDVVIYTLIDGKYYMNIAEKVTETVDKKGIDKHDETMTCDGTVYTQSHIGYTNDTYYHDVTEAHTEETYDLYLDHFGFVRLFIESDYNTFMLLTDGYYYDNNRTETFQAYYWNVEADEETQIDVIDNDYAADFIYDGKANIVNGDVNTWGRLKGADWTYLTGYDWRNTYASNIAGYTETDDGYALKSVEDSAERIDYTVQAFRPDELDDKTLKTAGDDIQTTTDTQYYLVIRSEDNRTVSGWNVDDVITWTGYNNVPADAELNFEDGDVVGYAVTRDTKTTGDYTVADVVVFETTAYSDRNTYFVYDVNNWDDIEYVYGIGYDDEGAIYDENKLLVEDHANVIAANEMIEFYKIYDDERVDFIGDDDGEYAANYIYAGETKTGYDVENRNYIRVDVFTKIAGEIVETDDMYISLDAPIYYVDENSNGYVVKELSRDKVDAYDKLIVFANKDDEVQYAIDVTASVDENGNIFDDLYNEVMALNAGEHDGMGLWNRIVADTVSINYVNLYEQVMDQARAALDANELDKLYAAEAALKALLDDENAKNELTADQIARLGAAYTLVGQAIAALEGEIDADQLAKQTVQALIDAYKAFQAATTTADKDAAREALFAAALAYEEYANTDYATVDADAAYDEAVDEANDVAKDVKAADDDLSSFAKIATAMAQIQLSDNGKALVQWDENGTPAEKDYNAAVKAIAEAAALYNKAKALVVAYDEWKAATLPSEVKAAWENLEAAYADISAKEHQSITTGTTDYDDANVLGTASYDTAYKAVADIHKGDDQKVIDAAVAALQAVTDEIKVASTENDADGIEAMLVPEIQKILAAKGIEGVTVEFTSGDKLTGCVKNAKTSDATPAFTLTYGAASGSVSVPVEFTHLYTEKELVAAINDAVRNTASAASQYNPNKDALENTVKTDIAKVTDVTTGESVEIVSVEASTSNGNWEAGVLVTVEYTVTYAGEQVSGSTTVTLTA